MSANISVKNIPEEKDSAGTKESLAESYRTMTAEEETVKSYEAFYSRLYWRVFILRILSFTISLALIFATIYAFKNLQKRSGFEFYFLMFSIIVSVASGLLIGSIKDKFLLDINSKRVINGLEDTIVKMKLKERFGSDIELNHKIEDFYIELNNMTKAKYETAFRFYSYEFYIYAIISLLIAVFFILRSF